MVRVPCSEPEFSNIVLVDTPGFDNNAEKMSDIQIVSMIQSWHEHLCVYPLLPFIPSTTCLF